jgi:hypothetical protein
MLCFVSRASCNNKLVDFNLLTVSLYILSTRVGKIHAHTSLVHVHSSVFCMYLPTDFEWPLLVACWLPLGMLHSKAQVTRLPLLRYAKTLARLSYTKNSNVTNVCVSKSRTPISGQCSFKKKCEGYSRKYSKVSVQFLVSVLLKKV